MKKPAQPKAGKPHATGKSSPAPPGGHPFHPAIGAGKPPHHQRRAGKQQKKAPAARGGAHAAHVMHHKPAPVKRPKRAKRKRGLAGVTVPGGWLLGGNDVLETCIAVAVANHRLLATGYAMSDAEILALAAAGQTIEETLGQAGCGFWPVDPDVSLPLVLGVPRHAVLGLPAGWVSWGGLIRPSGAIEEAWWLDWT